MPLDADGNQSVAALEDGLLALRFLFGFDGSCGAMAQGPTRMARGLAYARYVGERAGAQHEVKEVPSCGHNARCMFTDGAALALLFANP